MLKKAEYDITRQANVSTPPDLVLRAIEAFKYHRSILKLKNLWLTKVCHFLSAILKKKLIRHCKT